MSRAQNIPVGHDLNVLSRAGTYVAVDPLNAPAAGNFIVIVNEAVVEGNARQLQVAYSEADGTQYVRAFSGNGWTAWVLTGSAVIPSPVFTDSTFRVEDDVDATKKLALQLSAITTGTTRTLTVPDRNGVIFTTAADIARTSGNFIVADGTSFAAQAPATVLTTLGLDTSSSPHFAAINVGHATDTTIARVSAGTISVEGVNVVTTSSTDTLTNKTLTSPIIGGNVPFDTDTLYVDATNNRVGIGTASPGYRLEVDGQALVNGSLGAAIKHSNFAPFLMWNTATTHSFRMGTGSSNNFVMQAVLSATPATVVESFFSYSMTTSTMSLRTNGSTDRLTIDGSGNAAFDTSTLYVDAVNNRVGVGTASPSYPLHVKKASSGATAVSYSDGLVVEGGINSGISILGNGTGSMHFCMGYPGVEFSAGFKHDQTTGQLNIRSGNVYCMNFDGNQNVIFGHAAVVAGTSSVKNIVLTNGTAPTGAVSNGITLFAEDVAASSELRVMDEATNVTTLSPHNFSKIPDGRSEELAWGYYSERDGKYVNVDMMRAVRLIEKLTGEKLVFIGEVEKWPSQKPTGSKKSSSDTTATASSPRLISRVWTSLKKTVSFSA